MPDASVLHPNSPLSVEQESFVAVPVNDTATTSENYHIDYIIVLIQNQKKYC